MGAGATSRFIRPLLELLFSDLGPERIAEIHFWIRVIAHPTEYAILAGCLVHGFVRTRPELSPGGLVLRSLIGVLVVAGADELRQAASDARTGSIQDVGLDLAGGLLGAAGSTWLVRRTGNGMESGEEAT